MPSPTNVSDFSSFAGKLLDLFYVLSEAHPGVTSWHTGIAGAVSSDGDTVEKRFLEASLRLRGQEEGASIRTILNVLSYVPPDRLPNLFADWMLTVMTAGGFNSATKPEFSIICMGESEEALEQSYDSSKIFVSLADIERIMRSYPKQKVCSVHEIIKSYETTIAKFRGVFVPISPFVASLKALHDRIFMLADGSFSYNSDRISPEDIKAFLRLLLDLDKHLTTKKPGSNSIVVNRVNANLFALLRPALEVAQKFFRFPFDALEILFNRVESFSILGPRVEEFNELRCQLVRMTGAFKGGVEESHLKDGEIKLLKAQLELAHAQYRLLQGSNLQSGKKLAPKQRASQPLSIEEQRIAALQKEIVDIRASLEKLATSSHQPVSAPEMQPPLRRDDADGGRFEEPIEESSIMQPSQCDATRTTLRRRGDAGRPRGDAGNNSICIFTSSEARQQEVDLSNNFPIDGEENVAPNHKENTRDSDYNIASSASCTAAKALQSSGRSSSLFNIFNTTRRQTAAASALDLKVLANSTNNTGHTTKKM